MIWLNHDGLRDSHAYLSPSAKSWINYDEEKLKDQYFNSEVTRYGTELHAFASRAIKLRQYIDNRSFLVCNFVNDCIDYKMDVDVVLYYSRYCYGTVDAIKYDNIKNTLYVFDLKTGKTKASMMQLRIYAALFILEYNIIPTEIVLRIYQREVIEEDIPDIKDIVEMTKNIMKKSKVLEKVDAQYDKI